MPEKHSSSHFETVATAFQVADIAQRLAVVPPSYTVQDAFVAITETLAEFPDSNNFFCLVHDEGKTYGYIAAGFVFDEPDEKFDGPEDGPAGEYCTLISPDQIVSRSMPLLELIPLFIQSRFFFVLTRNEITHVVSFDDLDKLPIKLCLFSLIMALEAAMVDLFSGSYKGAETHLKLLPEARYYKALELCQQKYKDKVTPEKIILCTTFVDKQTILLRSPHLFGVLPFESKSKAEHFFKQVENLRNQIAHSDSIIEVFKDPDELDDFVVQLRKVTEAISNL